MTVSDCLFVGERKARPWGLNTGRREREGAMKGRLVGAGVKVQAGVEMGWKVREGGHAGVKRMLASVHSVTRMLWRSSEKGN